ncbi:MAG: tyrosine-type recombinase/integrase [Thiothrix sp.]|nr:tyrosine-type recombinase/integrase [Thiothrix sp.]HPQ95463.1 tyrosine-type recombinase/integrase [Thiolinea sp.]
MPLKESDVKHAVAADKPHKLSDDDGLYLLVKPLKDGKTGKYWRYDYMFAGKRKTLAYGAYPQVGITAARKAHQNARALLNSGICPSTEKRKHKQEQARIERTATSFRQVATDWHNHQKHNWVAKYAAIIMNRLEKDVFPHIGAMGIAEVKPADVVAIIKQTGDSGHIPKAREILNNLNAIYRYALTLELADRNPAGIDPSLILKPHVKKHHATITDPVQIGEMLRAIDAYHGHIATRAALQLASMVMLRPGELVGLLWDEVDLEAGTVTIEAARMKLRRHLKDANRAEDSHTVPLPHQAVALLKDLHQYTGYSPYLFPSMRTPKKGMNRDTLNTALRYMGIPASNMTAHGFRAMASTLLNEMGWNADVIERQLAHKGRDVVRRSYNHAGYLEERRAMLQTWADYLDSLRDGADVIPLFRSA